MTAKQFKEDFLSKKSFEEIATNYYGEEMMIEFAKYHVQKALKDAAENGMAYEKQLMFGYGTVSVVDTESILNSYPLENIK